MRNDRVVAAFVADVAAARFPHLFNPYADLCPIHDAPRAAAVRRANLTAYLRSLLADRPRLAIIGRDLGWRGGRRTGLPLTDEPHLPAYARKATVTPAVTERTAFEIHRVLAAPALLWNVVPWHPHAPDDPLSNRPHTAAEAAAGRALLARLLDAIQPRTIIALGRVAESALAALGRGATYVRHPSHGGQTLFRAQLAGLAQSSAGHGARWRFFT